MPWKKGVSGNPRGRPRKNQSIAELLRRYAQHPLDDTTAGETLIDALWSAAIAGDIRATRLILDHLIGRPPIGLHLDTNDAYIKAYVNISPDDWPDPPDPNKLTDDPPLRNRLKKGAPPG